jgi:polyisoprenoid-binding protein YceI
MKSFLTMALILTTTFSAVASDKPMAATYKLDNAATTIKWIGKKVLGEHSGNVAAKTGFLTVTGDIISAGEISIDMNTITCTDIPSTDENNGKLVGHLKSPDFFNVGKFPEAKLVIKGSEKTKKGLKIKGDLTFIGKTNPIEFEAAVNNNNGVLTAKSDVVLDRTKWDLKYGSDDFVKGLGDKAIKNEFTLSVSLSAKK